MHEQSLPASDRSDAAAATVAGPVEQRAALVVQLGDGSYFKAWRAGRRHRGRTAVRRRDGPLQARQPQAVPHLARGPGRRARAWLPASGGQGQDGGVVSAVGCSWQRQARRRSTNPTRDLPGPCRHVARPRQRPVADRCRRRVAPGRGRHVAKRSRRPGHIASASTSSAPCGKLSASGLARGMELWRCCWQPDPTSHIRSQKSSR